MYSDIDNRCIVLREGAGKFEVALDFTHLGRSASTCGADGQPSGLVDYNGAVYDSSSSTGLFRQGANFTYSATCACLLRLTTEEANFIGSTSPIWKVTTDYQLIGDNYVITDQTIEPR